MENDINVKLFACIAARCIFSAYFKVCRHIVKETKHCAMILLIRKYQHLAFIISYISKE